MTSVSQQQRRKSSSTSALQQQQQQLPSTVVEKKEHIAYRTRSRTQSVDHTSSELENKNTKKSEPSRKLRSQDSKKAADEQKGHNLRRKPTNSKETVSSPNSVIPVPKKRQKINSDEAGARNLGARLATTRQGGSGSGGRESSQQQDLNQLLQEQPSTSR